MSLRTRQRLRLVKEVVGLVPHDPEANPHELVGRRFKPGDELVVRKDPGRDSWCVGGCPRRSDANAMPDSLCTEGAVRKEKVIAEAKDSALRLAIDKKKPFCGFVINGVALDHDTCRAIQ